jgi:CRP-like cAMP-binding protein
MTMPASSVAGSVLSSLVDAPLPEWRSVAAQVEALYYPRGTPLFRAGAPARHVYFVGGGIVRLAYETTDGKERVKGFSGPARFFGSARALVGDGMASFTASALTPVHVERLAYAVLERMASTEIVWQKVLARGFQQFGMRKEQREHDLLTLDAEARYRRFLVEYADIHQQIPQKDVAAYIGITPVALSRIRGRLREDAGPSPCPAHDVVGLSNGKSMRGKG